MQRKQHGRNRSFFRMAMLSSLAVAHGFQGSVLKCARRVFRIEASNPGSSTNEVQDNFAPSSPSSPPSPSDSDDFTADDAAVAAGRAAVTAARLSAARISAARAKGTVGAAATLRATSPPLPRKLLSTDVQVQFSRSGGAGGQNVNKVETKAEVRLDVPKVASTFLSPAVVAHLSKREASKINKDGVLVVTSSAHRTQAANLKDAMGKVQAIIDSAVAAAAPPKPPSAATKAKIKHLARAEKNKMATAKRKQSEKKKSRKARVDFD